MEWWWTVLALVAHLGPGEDERWARQLTALDLQRAQAFAHADPQRLEQVYASEQAAAADAATITGYRDRGGRVVGAVLVLDDVRVVRSTSERVELDVVDRLGPTRVVWDDGTSRALPSDRPTRRVVVLQLTDDGWRISGSRTPGPS